MHKGTTAIILIIYFLFTSGVVFEAMQSTMIDKVDIPYNPSLSAERTGIVGVYTKCDVECAKWIVGNTQNTDKIAGDVNSAILMMSFIDKSRTKISNRDPVFDYQNLPNKGYIIILDWNARHKQGIRTAGVGIREVFPLPELPYPEVFRCGNSYILRKD